MIPTQFEQDDIHELVDAGWSARQIQDFVHRAYATVEACVARYGEFLRGEAPTPYLDGTRIPEPPGDVEGKLTQKRIVGGTDGQQVM